MQLRFATSTIFCLTLALAASACQRSTDDAPVTTTTPAGQSTAPSADAVAERDHALVRFVHAIPAGSTVDVFADDTRTFEGIAYKTVTPYREIDGQRYTFRLRPAGMTEGDPLASNSEGLDDGDHYTVFAVPGDDEAAMLRVVEDDFTVPGDGKARVRVVNAATDAGELDVFAAGRDDELFGGVNPRTVSSYNEIDPWSGALHVRADGERTVLAEVPNTRFDAGKVYTVVIAGKLRGSPKVEAFVIEDQIGAPPVGTQ